MDNLVVKLRQFKDNFLPTVEVNENAEKIPTLVELVNKAKEEWHDARNLFQEVTDPDLIDHAIYRMESAEKRYMYLLKIAHTEKVVNNQIEIY
ncbi:MAG: YaaL family protein [Peptococcales bacterium]